MDAITIVAVGIVLASVVLVAAVGFTLGAEKPRVPANKAAVPAKLWCPVAREEIRVGLGADPAGLGLTLAWCDRFPGGPIECDRACLPTKAAA